MKVSQITGNFGAEVEAVDLTRRLDPETVRALDQALTDYKVLVFRGQEAAAPRDLLALATHFGTPDVEAHHTIRRWTASMRSSSW